MDCEYAPSKFMRLGTGLSNRMKSAAVSCFELDFCSEMVISEPLGMSDVDLLDLFATQSH